MRTLLFLFCCIPLLVLSACSVPWIERAESDSLVPLTNDSSNEPMITDNRPNDRFGYASQERSPLHSEPLVQSHSYTIDRIEAAKAVSEMGMSIDHIVNMDTLVTSKEVLIAYQIDPNVEIDRDYVADQVKKMAFSIMPRYYHVYVSDDPKLQLTLKNLASRESGGTAIEESIAGTIDMMLERSPQGPPLDAGENPNGESIGDDHFRMKEDEKELAPASYDLSMRVTETVS